ncbi:protein of unknown function DUF683 [Thermocrinis albus DSM 14484]|uniref:Uncharacterized protein n=1 Tax=Thermocrinis albus (strain DSM 14484 / JCM 11386 / HI 11/12) TaxID=638303 RepID=D3SPI1_THEAH|nr:CCE_0567 family metalloprotein [Thermocrinis albus]ADC89068.1 protein of unknown function DUF683 [Thermocrinis albus DSM 14484]
MCVSKLSLDMNMEREREDLESVYSKMSLEELKEEVKKLRMMAVQSATKLHDLAEEGLPNRWREIPSVAKEAYEIHRKYFVAKTIFEKRSKEGG